MSVQTVYHQIAMDVAANWSVQMPRSIAAAAVLVMISSNTAFAADAVRGETRFRALCGSCHSADPAVRKMSSHMSGIVGRRAASIAGVPFSTALKTSGWTWSKPLLEKYLADPKKALPGTTMMVAAANAQDRADIVAYLATLK
jgi:cytochrome c